MKTEKQNIVEIQSLVIENHGGWADKLSVFVFPITCPRCKSSQFNLYSAFHAANFFSDICFECSDCGWKHFETNNIGVWE